jgi:hypothetical protein
MRIRVSAVCGVAFVALLLAGCGPGGGSDDPSGGSTPTESTAPTEQPAELVLPEDAVVGLVAIVTAPNGATADLSLVVHASLPYGLPATADAEAATLAWCAGEVDESVIIGRGYTFTAVDIRLSPRDGDWPADLSISVLPTPNPEVGSTLAVVGDLRQVDASDDDSFPDAVPHCLQPALLDGLGEGTLFLGIPNDISGVDAESFTAWTLHDFGVAAHLPGDLGESDVVFSSCTSAVTPLGEEFGAPNESWHESADPTLCSIGGSTFAPSAG